jgi:hypothetical protein
VLQQSSEHLQQLISTAPLYFHYHLGKLDSYYFSPVSSLGGKLIKKAHLPHHQIITISRLRSKAFSMQPFPLPEATASSSELPNTSGVPRLTLTRHLQPHITSTQTNPRASVSLLEDQLPQKQTLLRISCTQGVLKYFINEQEFLNQVLGHRFFTTMFNFYLLFLNVKNL